MTCIHEIINEIKETAKKIYEKDETKRDLVEWIYGWNGKLIRFHMDGKEFYLALTTQEPRILTGNYPGTDVDIFCSPETWMELWRGSERDVFHKLRTLMAQGKIRLWKNYNDFRSFVRIAKKASEI